MKDPVVIWGEGAMGGTIGAHLVRAGHDVVFIDTDPDHVRAMNEAGLRVTGPISEFEVEVTAARPAEVPAPFHTALLCVKAHHTEEAIRTLAPGLARTGFVVSVQNGLNEPQMADVVGERRTVGCFVNFGADWLAPGEVHYGGRGAVVLGELDGRISPRLRGLHELFRAFDDAAIVTRNIYGYLWGKLAYASMLFATALTDDAIADALDSSVYREVYVELAREVVRVADAHGVALEGFDGFDPGAFAPSSPAAAADRSLDELVAHNRRSAKTHSGIWRDLAVRKRRTEVDAQLGPVVELAGRLSVPVPLNERLIGLIHDIEDGKRDRSSANLDRLAALRT